jgi:hypothetical protein
MTDSARRFVPRAPRYILRTEDRKVMRFSLKDTSGPSGIEETVLVNLSETGVAFLAPPTKAFDIGELIKVEVPIPKGDQIAWWARVVRIEEYGGRLWYFSRDPFRDDPKLLIALRFEKLPEPHTRAIRKGIEESFLQAMRDQRYRTWMYYRVLLLKHMYQILFYIAISAAAFALLYWLAQPDENYDSKRGAPWGQRFKWLSP